jgi:predicted ATP-binding protein involved in virulence
MRLNSVHLTNYRCHGDLTIEFKPGFNVIVGVNGSGKTSVLKSLRDALTGFMMFMRLQYGQYHTLAEEGIAKIRTDVVDGRYRFESLYPVKVSAQADAFGNECNWAVYKSSQVDNPQILGMSPGQIWQNANQQLQVQEGLHAESRTLPIIAFYAANRHWNGALTNEMQAATQKNSRLDGYRSWWDASLDNFSLQSWVISKCLERLQTSSELSVAFQSIQNDELALVNAALSQAVEGTKGLKYDLKQKSLLVEWVDESREPTAFENLSDGQRAVIGLVSDIARRMCLLNPHLGSQVVHQTPGVVLIDELDMHLHPKWQRILTSGLKRAFPAVQFIVASHSPQVLGELQPDEIIVLHPEGTAHPQVSYGLDSSAVLEEIMEATARTPTVEKQVSMLFAALEQGQLSESRDLLSQLKLTAPGIRELAGAEALLKRKEIVVR